jgi:hypothetical protein
MQLEDSDEEDSEAGNYVDDNGSTASNENITTTLIEDSYTEVAVNIDRGLNAVNSLLDDELDLPCLSDQEGEACGGDGLSTNYMSILEALEDPLKDVGNAPTVAGQSHVGNAPTVASQTQPPTKVDDFEEKLLDMFSLGALKKALVLFPP